MKKINDFIDKIFAAIIAILIFIIFSPLILFILLIGIPIEKYNEYKFKKRLNSFIESNNKSILFLYSSKKRWKYFIQNYVLTVINKDIIFVYNDKGEIKSSFSLDIFNHYYYQLDKLKYPLFMKIIYDKAIGVSIYNDLVDLHDNKINAEQFQNQIKQKIKDLESQQNIKKTKWQN